MADPIRVRGTCGKCQHVVDTTAPKNRATWRGNCPKGCGAVVTAKRVRGEQPPPAAAAAPPAEDPKTRRPRRPIVKVAGYERGAPGASGAAGTGSARTTSVPAPVVPAAGDPTGSGPAGDGTAGSGEPPAGGKPAARTDEPDPEHRKGRHPYAGILSGWG